MGDGIAAAAAVTAAAGVVCGGGGGGAAAAAITTVTAVAANRVSETPWRFNRQGSGIVYGLASWPLLPLLLLQTAAAAVAITAVAAGRFTSAVCT